MHKYISGVAAAALISLGGAGRLAAQDMPAMPAMPGMEHHHHDEMTTEKLGTVHFPVSCSAAQQEPFERGIALLHSFGYTEATEQFQAIAKADPSCPMAHWGIAMAQFHEL